MLANGGPRLAQPPKVLCQMHQGDLLVVDAGHDVHGKLLADLQRNSRIWTGIEKDQSPGEELLS